MDFDLKELRELAQKATPGPWELKELPGDDEYYGQWCEVGTIYFPAARTGEDADERFIAAANPETILSMISRIEVLTAERDGFEAAADAARDRLTKRMEEMQQAAQARITAEHQVEAMRSAILHAIATSERISAGADVCDEWALELEVLRRAAGGAA